MGEGGGGLEKVFRMVVDLQRFMEQPVELK